MKLHHQTVLPDEKHKNSMVQIFQHEPLNLPYIIRSLGIYLHYFRYDLTADPEIAEKKIVLVVPNVVYESEYVV